MTAHANTGAGSIRAALWRGPGIPLVLDSVPMPRIEDPFEVVIAVKAAIFGAALVRAARVGHPRLRPPAMLGTLAAGDILSKGEGIDLPIGTAVTFDPHAACGRCGPCLEDSESQCLSRGKMTPGCLSDAVKLSFPITRRLHRVPAGLSYAKAAYTETIACVMEATLVAGIDFGHSVAIVGCGPIAMLQIQLALMRGASKVLCLYNHPERGKVIAALGGIPIDARDGSAEDQIRGLCGGSGADAVIEAAGREETYAQSLRLVRPGGVVVGFGGCPPGTRLEIDPNRLHYGNIRFIGSYHYRRGLFAKAMDLLSSGRIDLELVLSHRLPLSRIAEAPGLAGRPDCVALVIEPDGKEGNHGN